MLTTQFDRGVGENNIPSTFEYGKGWSDYVELIRRFSHKFKFEDVRVISGARHTRRDGGAQMGLRRSVQVAARVLPKRRPGPPARGNPPPGPKESVT